MGNAGVALVSVSVTLLFLKVSGRLDVSWFWVVLPIATWVVTALAAIALLGWLTHREMERMKTGKRGRYFW